MSEQSVTDSFDNFEAAINKIKPPVIISFDSVLQDIREPLKEYQDRVKDSFNGFYYDENA